MNRWASESVCHLRAEQDASTSTGQINVKRGIDILKFTVLPKHMKIQFTHFSCQIAIK